MPIVGIVRRNGVLQYTEDALNRAALDGHVDNVPLPILTQILHNRQVKGPSASQIAGLTWRRTVLEKLIDYFVRPQDELAKLRGTLVHTGLQGVNLERINVHAMTEVRLFATLPGHPHIKVSGQIDVYYPDFLRLEDYKTCFKVPDLIKEEHAFQLAVYYWLLKWNNHEVTSAAIDYISWEEMKQVSHTESEDGKIVPVVEHPYFTDETEFSNLIAEGYNTLVDGFNHAVVPPESVCNLNYCRNCPLRWACHQIDPKGQVIVPEKFVQRDYR